MKKILSILLSIISVISIAFAFGGCGDETVEVRGRFYNLEEAYENYWLDEDDLKSIACCYYDYYYAYKENPYSGMYNSTELSEKMENEVKQAFLEKIVESSTISREKVHISKYYGTYNGNIIIYGYCEDVWIEYEYAHEANIGGVIFEDFWSGKCLVYHINQADENQTNEHPIEVKGQFYNFKEAVENGWLNEDSLKSIACIYYDSNYYSENPYRGMATSSEQLSREIKAEIKQAFLEQIVEDITIPREKVHISNYYGTYNGNIIIYVYCEGVSIEYEYANEANIGGVIFEDYCSGYFQVYHLI